MIGKDKKVTKVIDIYDTNVKFFNKQAKNRFENASLEFGESRVKIVGASERIINKQRNKSITSEQGIDAQMKLLNSFSLDDVIKPENRDNIQVTKSQQNLFNMFKR